MSRILCACLMCLCVIGLSISGCTGSDGGVTTAPDQGVAKYTTEIRAAVRIGTSLAMVQAKVPADKVQNIKDFVVAARNILSANQENPNFDGVRAVVGTHVPKQYQVAALTVIDLIQSNANRIAPKLNNKQAQVQAVILAGVDGALEAIAAYTPQ